MALWSKAKIYRLSLTRQVNKICQRLYLPQLRSFVWRGEGGGVITFFHLYQVQVMLCVAYIEEGGGGGEGRGLDQPETEYDINNPSEIVC